MATSDATHLRNQPNGRVQGLRFRVVGLGFHRAHGVETSP